MGPSKDEIREQLRRGKGPDMVGNIVDLGVVSGILLKDGRVSFSITVPAQRATELEPLRQAAEKVVSGIKGVAGVVAVLTAERLARQDRSVPESGQGQASAPPKARARGTTAAAPAP